MISTVSAIKVPLLFKLDESLANMKNNIIFSTNFKIFFYDYITDGIKQINETEIEKKNIKKVLILSIEDFTILRIQNLHRPQRWLTQALRQQRQQ
jgi:hypothetical protein